MNLLKLILKKFFLIKSMNKKNIYFLYIIQFISNFYMINVIRTLFFESKGISFYGIGIILATYQATKCIFEIPTGFIADKFGKRISCIIGFVLFEIFLISCLSSKTLYQFIFSAICQGISYTFLSGALDALFIDSIIQIGDEANLDKYNSINRALFYISIGTSSLLGGYIASFNYELVFIITILIQLIPIFLLYLVTTENNKTDISKVNIKVSIILNYLIKNKLLLHLLFIDCFIAISMIPIDSYYSNYLKSLGINEVTIGIIIFMQYFFSALIGLMSSKITFFVNEKKLLLIFPLLMIICFIIFSFSPNKILSILFYLIGLIIFSLFAPQKYKTTHKNLCSNFRATVLSLQSLFIGLIATIIQPIYGSMSERYGLNIAFIILLLISLTLLIINNIFLNKFINQSTVKIPEKIANPIEKKESQKESQ